MTEKKTTNKVLIIIAVIVISFFLFLIFSNKGEKYSGITQIPTYQEGSKPSDGDTQADTIKALQAYAKEAVDRAETLNKQTKSQVTQVLENKAKVDQLQQENDAIVDAAEKMTAYIKALEEKQKTLESQLSSVESSQQEGKQQFDEHGIPVGFGFEHLRIKRNVEEGVWNNPIDRQESHEKKEGNRYAGLLKPPGKPTAQSAEIQSKKTQKVENKIIPEYTLPKDSVLYDGLALTALVGRIPVEGTTPDPYPVKVFIGKENLAANGHIFPEVEGMIFSGIGIGDWNLSCVSVRLFSATYIFDDGSVVNHTSSSGTPLGYISDQQGWPCVAGIFKTNAPTFLRQRIGLAGLGAAGSAYANAQTETTRSGLTGNATASLTGNINKLVAGTVVQSATDEVTAWLLERQKQSFDAVIVDPGAAVSIHLDQTLAIDRSTFARKLRYQASHTTYHSTLD